MMKKKKRRGSKKKNGNFITSLIKELIDIF